MRMFKSRWCTTCFCGIGFECVIRSQHSINVAMHFRCLWVQGVVHVNVRACMLHGHISHTNTQIQIVEHMLCGLWSVFAQICSRPTLVHILVRIILYWHNLCVYAVWECVLRSFCGWEGSDCMNVCVHTFCWLPAAGMAFVCTVYVMCKCS